MPAPFLLLHPCSLPNTMPTTALTGSPNKPGSRASKGRGNKSPVPPFFFANNPISVRRASPDKMYEVHDTIADKVSTARNASRRSLRAPPVCARKPRAQSRSPVTRTPRCAAPSDQGPHLPVVRAKAKRPHWHGRYRRKGPAPAARGKGAPGIGLESQLGSPKHPALITSTSASAPVRRPSHVRAARAPVRPHTIPPFPPPHPPHPQRPPASPEVGPGTYNPDPLHSRTTAVPRFQPGQSHRMLAYDKDPTRPSPAFKSPERCAAGGGGGGSQGSRWRWPRRQALPFCWPCTHKTYDAYDMHARTRAQ